MIDLGLQKPISDTKVVVAMSGGVDSSTVAALMVEAGYDVIGITLQLYDYGEALKKKGACCAGQDIHDAKRVAEILDIPHYVLNYESLFKESVIDDFADSYLRGETPLPCVRCNQSVKFKDLFATAKDLGADALVTGHYVRRIEGTDGPELHQGVDLDKDQSYFLFATTKEQLDFLHFPLGSMNKEETRAHAKRFDLAVADKPDSQDICFVPNGSYAKVIEKLRPEALSPGEIVDMDGNVLGTHNGITGFTIGQRKGLGISSVDPLYVIGINAAQKRVIVGPEEALGDKNFYINSLNWLGHNHIPKNGMDVSIKIRSTGTTSHATILPLENNRAKIQTDTPIRAVSPGQACVLYDGSHILGGGWITPEHQEEKLATLKSAA